MFELFEGQTADEAWLKIAAEVRTGQKFRPQDGRGGDTLEILHAGISVADPRQRWVVSRQRPLNLPFALAEVVWILNGRDDTRFVKYFNPRLTRYTGTAANLHGAYGRRLRSHLGFDQLERAYRALASRRHSRQVALQIWDGRIDLPTEDGIPRSDDIPCNLISMLKVRDGRLDWTQVMRSNDIYKGLPYNLVQFTSLQEVLAGWIGIEMGGYYHLSDSLHVYQGEELSFVTQSTVVPADSNRDVLALSFSESTAAWSELARIGDRVMEETNPEALGMSLRNTQLPEGFKNIARVLVGDGLRRRGLMTEAFAMMAGCTNALYRGMWDRWAEAATSVRRAEPIK